MQRQNPTIILFFGFLIFTFVGDNIKSGLFWYAVINQHGRDDKIVLTGKNAKPDHHPFFAPLAPHFIGTPFSTK